MDIVGSAVPEADDIDLRDFKKQLFLAILEAERAHLTGIEDLIDELEAEARAL